MQFYTQSSKGSKEDEIQVIIFIFLTQFVLHSLLRYNEEVSVVVKKKSLMFHENKNSLSEEIRETRIYHSSL